MKSDFLKYKAIVDDYISGFQLHNNTDRNFEHVIEIFKENYRVLAKALFILEPQQKKIFLLQNPNLDLQKYKDFVIPNFSFEVLSEIEKEKLKYIDLVFEGIRESHNTENPEELPEFLTALYTPVRNDLILPLENKLKNNQLIIGAGEIIFYSISWYFLLNKLSIEGEKSSLKLSLNTNYNSLITSDTDLSLVSSKDNKFKFFSNEFISFLQEQELNVDFQLFTFMSKEFEKRRKLILDEIQQYCTTEKFNEIESFLDSDIHTYKQKENLLYLLPIEEIPKSKELINKIDNFYNFRRFLTHTIGDASGLGYIKEFSLVNEYNTIGLPNNKLNITAFVSYLNHLANILTNKFNNKDLKNNLDRAKSCCNLNNLKSIANYHYVVLYSLLFNEQQGDSSIVNNIKEFHRISRLPHIGYYFYHKVLRGHFFEHFVFEIRKGIDKVFDIPSEPQKKDIYAKAFGVMVLNATNSHIFNPSLKSVNSELFNKLEEVAFLSEHLYSPFVDKNYYDSIVRKSEQMQLFDTLFHSQKQYMRAIEAFSNKLDKDKRELLQYFLGSLQGFLEIISLYKKDQLDKLNEKQDWISLSSEIISIVNIFTELILPDKSVLSNSLQKIDFDRREYLHRNSIEGNTIFEGNFRTEKISPSKQVPEVVRLILKEAIVNALEHCNQKAPKIEINLHEDKYKYIIDIRNNSVADEQDLSFMRNPNLEKGKLGWFYIRFFVENVLDKWEIEVDSKESWTWYKFKIFK